MAVDAADEQTGLRREHANLWGLLHYRCGRLVTVRRAEVGIPSGRSPFPPGFGIITRRTGAGLYVFSIRSFLTSDNHSSRPAASIIAKLTPSTPGAPLFERIRS